MERVLFPQVVSPNLASGRDSCGVVYKDMIAVGMHTIAYKLSSQRCLQMLWSLQG